MNPQWDERKNRINKRRHKLSFETALRAFDDPFAVTAEDYVDENEEMRYQTIGLVDGLLIFVAHVYRTVDVEEKPWIISARKAVNHEKEIYWSNQRTH
ncbi:MAG TPA: BrnT family toxin [Bryobacteraceae bacterium]